MKKSFDDELTKEIVLPASTESVPALIEFVSDHARDMAFEDARIEKISLALKEALDNILRFACTTGKEEIKITCDSHEMGSLILNIIDTGVPFNMLVMSAFPEVLSDSSTPPEIPSTKIMKRTIRDIEYRRDGAHKSNILAWVVQR